MISTALDLDAYFARISFTGPAANDLATLRILHAAHVGSIPFENVDVQLGRGVSLGLPDIMSKLVARRRGGYCFEQNGLFGAVLEALGFEVERYLARVRWMIPEEVPTPKSHLVLCVTVEGERWLCDVGFGGIGIIHPIRFDERGIQHEEYEPRRVLETGTGLLHQALVGDQWLDVYSIQAGRIYAVDLEVSNWFTSSNPQSFICQNLITTISGPEQRISLFNDELSIRRHGERAAVRRLNSQEEVVAALSEHFGISLDSEEAAMLPFRERASSV